MWVEMMCSAQHHCSTRKDVHECRHIGLDIDDKAVNDIVRKALVVVAIGNIRFLV